jgi:hypothetical protein
MNTELSIYSIFRYGKVYLCTIIGLLSLTTMLRAQAWPPSGQLTSTHTSTTQKAGNCTATTTDYSWTFTDSSGTAHPFSSTSSSLMRIGPGCGGTIFNPLDTWSIDGAYYLTANGPNGSITAIGGTLDPKYKVVSILYATPGNFSSDSFTNSTTSGSVTTIGQSLSQGISETLSLGFLGSGATLQFGASSTTGKSNAFTETIADASSVGNASNTSGPNTLSHSQDLLLIWLNPEVKLSQTSSTSATYSVETPSQNGSTEIPDIVEVTAATLQNNGGSTNVPLSILQRQYDPITGQYDLPGLANVCANQSQYQNNCPSGGQCGCGPNDFSGILATDPIVNTTTATNPMSVDTSGIQTCTSPASGDGCRYVIVPATNGSPIQQDSLLSGPECSGCGRPVNSYTQTDTTSTTQTLSESSSESVGYTTKIGFPLVGSMSSTTTWTWTDTESIGAINGQANQIGYSLSSGTVGCYQDVLVYEDTIFHTFVTQLAPGNTSCP